MLPSCHTSFAPLPPLPQVTSPQPLCYSFHSFIPSYLLPSVVFACSSPSSLAHWQSGRTPCIGVFAVHSLPFHPLQPLESHFSIFLSLGSLNDSLSERLSLSLSLSLLFFYEFKWITFLVPPPPTFLPPPPTATLFEVTTICPQLHRSCLFLTNDPACLDHVVSAPLTSQTTSRRLDSAALLFQAFFFFSLFQLDPRPLLWHQRASQSRHLGATCSFPILSLFPSFCQHGPPPSLGVAFAPTGTHFFPSALHPCSFIPPSPPDFLNQQR